MSQSRSASFTEAVANLLIRYTVAVLSQMAIFPLFGVYLSIGENMLMALWFTIISLIRSYYVRRLFNRLHVTGVLR